MNSDAINKRFSVFKNKLLERAAARKGAIQAHKQPIKLCWLCVGFIVPGLKSISLNWFL